jgi:hypothetical protein
MTSLQSTSVQTQVIEQKTQTNPVTTSSSSTEESCCYGCVKTIFSCCFTTSTSSTQIRVKPRQQIEYLSPVSVSPELDENPSRIISSVKYDSQNIMRSTSRNKELASPPPSPRNTPDKPVITVHNQNRHSTSPTSTRSPHSASLTVKKSASSQS